jgi:hypothetical protein
LKDVPTRKIQLKALIATLKKMAEQGQLEVEIPLMLMPIAAFNSDATDGDSIVAIGGDGSGHLQIDIAACSAGVAVFENPVPTDVALEQAAGNAALALTALKVYRIHQVVYDEQGAAGGNFSLVQVVNATGYKIGGIVAVGANVEGELLSHEIADVFNVLRTEYPG